MKGVLFLGDRIAEVREFPDPEPGPGQARVRMRAASICGSDMHRYRHSSAKRGEQVKVIAGHEPCGVIDGVGDGVESLHIGDRVIVDMSMGCGRCEHCLRGDDRYCAASRTLGSRWHGSMADFVIADQRSCFALPTEISFVAGAVCACAGGTAYRATRDLRVSGSDIVAVIGLGPLGMVGVLFAKAMGARVIGVDIIAERLGLARDLGADGVVNASSCDPVLAIKRLTGGRGADVVIDYSGSPMAQAQSLDAARIHGKVCWVGVNEGSVTIDPSMIVDKQLHLNGSLIYGLTDVPGLLRFVVEHRLPLESVVSHRFAIAEATEALRLFDTGKTGKIAFIWDETE